MSGIFPYRMVYCSIEPSWVWKYTGISPSSFRVSEAEFERVIAPLVIESMMVARRVFITSLVNPVSSS